MGKAFIYLVICVISCFFPLLGLLLYYLADKYIK